MAALAKAQVALSHLSQVHAMSARFAELGVAIHRQTPADGAYDYDYQGCDECDECDERDDLEEAKEGKDAAPFGGKVVERDESWQHTFLQQQRLLIDQPMPLAEYDSTHWQGLRPTYQSAAALLRFAMSRESDEATIAVLEHMRKCNHQFCVTDIDEAIRQGRVKVLHWFRANSPAPHDLEAFYVRDFKANGQERLANGLWGRLLPPCRETARYHVNLPHYEPEYVLRYLATCYDATRIQDMVTFVYDDNKGDGKRWSAAFPVSLFLELACWEEDRAALRWYGRIGQHVLGRANQAEVLKLIEVAKRHATAHVGLADDLRPLLLPPPAALPPSSCASSAKTVGKRGVWSHL
jgi:hypothetical protein